MVLRLRSLPMATLRWFWTMTGRTRTQFGARNPIKYKAPIKRNGHHENHKWASHRKRTRHRFVEFYLFGILSVYSAAAAVHLCFFLFLSFGCSLCRHLVLRRNCVNILSSVLGSLGTTAMSPPLRSPHLNMEVTKGHLDDILTDELDLFTSPTCALEITNTTYVWLKLLSTANGSELFVRHTTQEIGLATHFRPV